MTKGRFQPIPIEVAKKIAEAYGYDQIVVIGRAVGDGEHVTTYGVDDLHCDAAARTGNYLKHRVMGWHPEEGEAEPPEWCWPEDDGEYGVAWKDRYDVLDDPPIGDFVEVKTAYSGPRFFLCRVPTEMSEDGDIEDSEGRTFTSAEAAEQAVADALKALHQKRGVEP